MIDLNFIQLVPDAKLPTKAHDNDTGWDVYCTEEATLNPGESKVVPVGLQLAYITPGYWILIACRSGLGFKHNLTVHHGVIDEGYRGSLDVLVRNLDKTRPYTFRKGDKVAQLVIYPLIQSNVEWAEEVHETKRGEKGFGSSDELKSH